VHELVRTNNAVLITAIEALLKGADIPHMVLDRHMSVLEGSLGMLPRRIVVDAEDWAVARQLLEDAGLAHELRPASSGPKSETTDDAVLGGRLRLTQKKRGHRVGHDAILLAAVTDARPGDRVVDFGAGVGAAAGGGGAGGAASSFLPQALRVMAKMAPTRRACLIYFP